MKSTRIIIQTDGKVTGDLIHIENIPDSRYKYAGMDFTIETKALEVLYQFLGEKIAEMDESTSKMDEIDSTEIH